MAFHPHYMVMAAGSDDGHLSVSVSLVRKVIIPTQSRYIDVKRMRQFIETHVCKTNSN